MKVEYVSRKSLCPTVCWTQLWGDSVGLQRLGLEKENLLLAVLT